MHHATGPGVGSKQWAAGTGQATESKRGGGGVEVSPEAPAEPQLDADDSVLVANPEQRKVLSERPFKLDDPVL
jgi:hypothetical protein